MTDEEFVVAHWERADLCESMLGAAFCISLGGRGFTRANVPGRDADSAEKAWAAAAEFTRERLEEIRCLESDMIRVRSQMDRAALDSIKVIEGRCGVLSRDLDGPFAACSYGWARILARLDSALADLKRGMKPTP